MERKRNENLPEELVHEILLRMSVKTLLVCKCVCRDWLDLIKSRRFISQHFNHERNQDCLFFRLDNVYYDDDNQYAYTKYVDDVRPSRVDDSDIPQFPTDGDARLLIGPENGVFCVVRNINHVGLLNPATREFKRLPLLPIRADPIEVWPVMGFGLDPSSGDFKVVAFKRSESYHFAFVYNLSNDSWKTIEDAKALDIFDVGDEYNSHRIFNGVNYWLGMIIRDNNLHGEFADSDLSYSILTFDMRSEKFQEMAIPDNLRYTTSDLRIARHCDSIALLSFEKECLDLWVIGRDGLWCKSLSINGPFQEVEKWTFCVWKKNEVLFGASSSTLVVYDITTRKARTLIRGRNQDSSDPFICDHFIYKESLVSIK